MQGEQLFSYLQSCGYVAIEKRKKAQVCACVCLCVCSYVYFFFVVDLLFDVLSRCVYRELL
eukprot:m.78046 g.78046  ORF g.78046 m.78046 type:complete len:61 (+) comp11940_c1_seq1:154-336(+)